MEKINIMDINFKKLQRIKSKYHIESDIYHNGTTTYKIFKNMSKQELATKQRKIELLGEGATIPTVVMPIDEIVAKDYFWGYTMDYIKNTIPLFDFRERSNNINLFIKILISVSHSLEVIHQDPRNIIVGDLNFDNIVIDKKFNPYFLDFDSCTIDGIPNETIPAILGSYLDIKGIPVSINQNSDKLSLLLCALSTILDDHILSVPMYEYDKRAEHIKTLKNIRPLVLELKKTNQTPTVPYFHELILESDIKLKTRKRI